MERMSACPSQRAMTAVSTPAWSRVMAQLWRRTWGWTLSARQRRASFGGGGGVVVDESFDGVAAEAPSGAGREQRVVAAPGSFARARRAATASAGAVRGTARCLASFAFAADVGAGAEGDVAAVEAGELGDAQPGLHGEQQQGPVASAFPSVRVGRGDEGVDLGGGEERHDRLVEPFRRDGQDPLDQQGVLGVAQRRRRRTATGSRSAAGCGSAGCCAVRSRGGRGTR